MRRLAAALVLSLVAGCGGDASKTVITLYTSVTGETVDAVVAGFEAANPDVDVEVLRAPTGEINARIASDLRTGGLRADVVWLTDPLSMQRHDAAGLLLAATPDASSVPADARADRFWGTRFLNLVIVSRFGHNGLTGWDDLVGAASDGGVALPDPSLAGSAFAALGYFATHPDYGMGFLRRLHEAGAVRVGTPGDVVTGVAEGQYAAGITLDFSARQAIDKGSPIDLVWPSSGAIAVFSPIAVTGEGRAPVDFVSYVLGVEAQTAIAESGWQPVHPEIPWNVAGPLSPVPWDEIYDHQEELLDAFRAIFGG